MDTRSELKPLPGSTSGDHEKDAVEFPQRNVNAYGNVSISGDSVAHLGDNNLNGPISVNQLTVLIRNEQITPDTQSDAASIRRLLRPLSEPHHPGSVHRSLARRLEFVVGDGETLAKLWLITSRHIQNALHFREESLRQYTLKDAHSSTFDWAFKHSNDNVNDDLLSWFSYGHSCYWINGKAGSGKSTFMKYLSQNAALYPLLQTWAGEKDLIFAEHYFWYAGTSLQKSHEGILRSLLRQILAQRPDIAPIIFPGLARHLEQMEDTDESGRISILSPELEKALDMLACSMPGDIAIFLIIDGIDEYSGDIFEFCKLLTRLGKNPSIKILMSSRPIPTCSHMFARFPGLRMQDVTHDDIEKYINDELMDDPLLQDMDMAEPGTALDIKQKLVGKASGVFLWIVLVVKDFLIGLGEYDDWNSLDSRIDRLPSDLEHLYDHMLARLSKEHQREGSMLLQIIKRALKLQENDLSALQLSLAKFPESVPPSAIQNKVLSAKEESLKIKMIDGRLRSRCGGLVEVQFWENRKKTPTKPRIDFLHRTVVEWLNQYSVWESIARVSSMNTSDMDLVLLASCLATLNAENGQIADHKTRITRLFQHCLLYSNELQKAGEVSYVDYLDAAEQISLDRLTSLQKGPSLYPRAYYHNTLYQQIRLKCLYRHDALGSQRGRCRALHGLDLNNNFALFCIAISSLHEFWRHKLATPLPRFSGTEVLISLLATISDDLKLSTAYAPSIEMLIRASDPNDFPYNINTELLHEIYGLGHFYSGHYSDPGVNTKRIVLSSWHFWLGVCENRRTTDCRGVGVSTIASVQDLRIIAAFVNMGAKLISHDHFKARAIDAIRRDLQSAKDNGVFTSVEDQKLLNEILHQFRLGQAA